jgi:hypothetical protein
MERDARINASRPQDGMSHRPTRGVHHCPPGRPRGITTRTSHVPRHGRRILDSHVFISSQERLRFMLTLRETD